MMSIMFMQSDDPLAAFKNPGSSLGEVLLLIGAAIVVAAIFFVWAAYVRRPKKMRHTYDHLNGDHDGSRRKKSSGGRLFGRKRRRRRRSSHSREQPVNPTLAQVGGLPPRRDEKRRPS